MTPCPYPDERPAAVAVAVHDCEHTRTEPVAGRSIGESRCLDCGVHFPMCPGCSEDQMANSGMLIHHAAPLCRTAERAQRRGPFAHLATGNESLDDVLADAKFAGMTPWNGEQFALTLDDAARVGRLWELLANYADVVKRGRPAGGCAGWLAQQEVRLGMVWRAYRAAIRETR